MEDAIGWMTVAIVACSLTTVGHAFTVLATPLALIANVHVLPLPYTHYLLWVEIFVTAKSTTKITNSSTPRKLPAIW